MLGKNWSLSGSAQWCPLYPTCMLDPKGPLAHSPHPILLSSSQGLAIEWGVKQLLLLDPIRITWGHFLLIQICPDFLLKKSNSITCTNIVRNKLKQGKLTKGSRIPLLPLTHRLKLSILCQCCWTGAKFLCFSSAHCHVFPFLQFLLSLTMRPSGVLGYIFKNPKGIKD